MGPREQEAARRRGQRKLDAMKRRAGLLRRRVVATAIVGFVLLWTVVFVQMATGNDPMLGAGAATTRSGTKKGAVTGAEQRGPQAAGLEAERVEAEQIEIEQREVEARELEELEPVTTGQS